MRSCHLHHGQRKTTITVPAGNHSSLEPFECALDFDDGGGRGRQRSGRLSHRPVEPVRTGDIRVDVALGNLTDSEKG